MTAVEEDYLEHGPLECSHFYGGKKLSFVVPESSGGIRDDQSDLLYEKDFQHASQRKFTRPPRILERKMQPVTPKDTALKIPSRS